MQNNNLKIINIYSFLFTVVLFVIILRPWPDPGDYPGIVLFTDMAVSVLVFLVGFLFVLLAKALPYRNIFVVVFFLYTVSIYASLIYNFSNLMSRDLIDFFRPVYFLSLFFIGYYSCKNLGSEKASNIFFNTIIVLGVVQVLLSSLQLIVPSFFEHFSVLYSMHKIEVRQMRATGTFGNPNHLGIFLIAAQISVLTSVQNRYKKPMLWSFFLVGIVLTGSILLTPLSFITTFLYFMLTAQTSTKIAYIVSLPIVMTSALFVIIFSGFSTRLNRLRVLMSDLSVQSFMEFRNLKLRYDYWVSLFERFDVFSELHFIFGFGPMKGHGLSFADNEYLFIFLRHGLLGLLAAATVFLLIVCFFYKRLKIRVSVFALLFVFSLFVMMPFFEVFSLWRLMPYYLIPFGIVVAASHKKKLIASG